MVRVGAGVLAVLLVVGIAAGIGLGIHGATYNGQVDEYSAGSPDTEDRVSVMAVIEKVDSAQYVMNVRVWAVAHGRFTSDGGETANRDIRVRSNAMTGDGLLLAAGRRVGAVSVPVEFDRGEIANYPLDRYSGDLYFSAVVDGQNVPVELTLENSDALFTLGATAHPDRFEPAFRVQERRSPSTLIMVGMMFVIMWALALAVAAAAAVVVRNRLGLVWPALAWMAATLFALAAFRGTAPGNPPIGTVLDLTAFLWSEAVVACALVGVVIRGVSLEWAKPVQPA